MESNPTPTNGDEVLHNFFPLFRIFKDGRIERYQQTLIVPPSDDPQTGVRSKDVTISQENKVAARLFIPSSIGSDLKVPILIYIHGGAFAIESAFSSLYHDYLSSVVAKAKVIAVSIEYRLAPEHPIPACFDDSWAAMKWVTSHAIGRQGPEPWINNHGDFTRIFVAGDSAGGNIAHNVTARASADGLEEGVKIVGMILFHPFFGNGKPDGIWESLCRDSKGCDDPRMNPMAHPSIMSSLICSKILIFTAEKDFLRERGWLYYEALKKSGWGGEVEILETEGEDHVFHLMMPTCENARIMMKGLSSFFWSVGDSKL